MNSHHAGHVGQSAAFDPQAVWDRDDPERGVQKSQDKQKILSYYKRELKKNIELPAIVLCRSRGWEIFAFCRFGLWGALLFGASKSIFAFMELVSSEVDLGQAMVVDGSAFSARSSKYRKGFIEARREKWSLHARDALDVKDPPAKAGAHNRKT